jgi:UrcA family protein
MRKMTMNIPVTIAIAATLSIALAAPALAQESSAHATISYSDIDMNTDRGQRVLALRIHHAADSLCESADERLSSKARRVANQCRAQVKRDARTAINDRAAVKIARR